MFKLIGAVVVYGFALFGLSTYLREKQMRGVDTQDAS